MISFQKYPNTPLIIFALIPSSPSHLPFLSSFPPAFILLIHPLCTSFSSVLTHDCLSLSLSPSLPPCSRVVSRFTIAITVVVVVALPLPRSRLSLPSLSMSSDIPTSGLCPFKIGIGHSTVINRS